MEISISLLVAPGDGLRNVRVPAGTTIAQLFASENLVGRSPVVWGKTVTQDYVLSYGDVRNGAIDIVATQVTKGA